MEGSQGDNASHGIARREQWKSAEDVKLKDLIAQFGPRNWRTIAEHFEGRTGKSCRMRWYNHLDPSINKLPFSKEEETKLILAQKAHGNKWSTIARQFPGRTDNSVKNHFHVMAGSRRKSTALSLRFSAPTRDNRVLRAHAVGHNIVNNGIMINEPVNLNCATNDLIFSPEKGTLCSINFGSTASTAALGNSNAAVSGSEFSCSDLGFGTAEVEEADNAVNEDISPPFFDFLGVGSKSQEDNEP